VRKALATLEGELAQRRAGKRSELLDTLVAIKQAEKFRLGEPPAPPLVKLGRRGARSVGEGGAK
jgi:hypothetical protein